MTRIPNSVIPSINTLAQSATSLTPAPGGPGMLPTIRSKPMLQGRLTSLDMRSQKTTMTSLRSSAKPPRQFNAAPLPGDALSLARRMFKQDPSR
jgi:hypothetical protein